MSLSGVIFSINKSDYQDLPQKILDYNMKINRPAGIYLTPFQFACNSDLVSAGIGTGIIYNAQRNFLV